LRKLIEVRNRNRKEKEAKKKKKKKKPAKKKPGQWFFFVDCKNNIRQF
jgi:hypothetical protein